MVLESEGSGRKGEKNICQNSPSSIFPCRDTYNYWRALSLRYKLQLQLNKQYVNCPLIVNFYFSYRVSFGSETKFPGTSVNCNKNLNFILYGRLLFTRTEPAFRFCCGPWQELQSSGQVLYLRDAVLEFHVVRFSLKTWQQGHSNPNLANSCKMHR